MQFAGHRCHAVWEFVEVLLQEAALVSMGGPTVIEHDIVVAHISQAGLDEYLGSVEEK